ncbi:DUF922 domain-containing protein [Parerythrobacter jejuensis]|nr:DUF922 domain-containing protein [Parerythrobacter jejuensis]
MLAKCACLGALPAMLAAIPVHASTTASRFADFPQTTIDYFEIEGANPADWQGQLDTLGPKSKQNDHRNAATTRYTIDWNYNDRGGNTCDSHLEVKTVVFFPRLRNRASLTDAARQEWDRFTDALEAHEARHLEMIYAAIPSLRRALMDGSCTGAVKRAQRIVSKLDRDQARFDAETGHGTKEGTTFRW